MALNGNLSTMPLPDILQFLGLGRKTGVLTVEEGPLRKQVAFENGMAVFCSSGRPKEYLGQQLLARTSLTEQDLAAAFKAQEETGGPLGEVLVRSGKISAADLHTVLARKVEDSLYDLFTWKSGRFQFDERPAPRELVPIRLALGWQDVVMEGARRADELARMAQVVAGPWVRFLVHQERFPQGFPKTGGDRKLVQLVERGLSVGDICPRFHASDFDILQRLCTLVLEGILSIDVAGSQPPSPRADAERMLECVRASMRLGSLGQAFETIQEGRRRFPDEPGFAQGQEELTRELRSRFAAGGEMAAVPRLARPLEEVLQEPLSSKEGFVVSRIDGQWNVRVVMQLCPFDELEVLTILDGLIRRGLVTIELRSRTTV